MLWTSPAYTSPEYDKTHKYSVPINVSVHGLHLDVSAPGARLGLHFDDGGHNMQVLLPITVRLSWDADSHRGHAH